MRRSLLILTFCCLATCLSFSATLADSLRQRLPSLHGEARLVAYEKLYRLSLSTGDANYQLRCLNDFIRELQNSRNNSKLLTAALVDRIVLYYNYDMTDSVYQHAPADLETLKSNKQWNKCYEYWMYLVNTYVFSGKYNMALREVQAMFDDAKSRDNKYGMGIAYYLMGNVYSNMHNREESVSAYRKGLDLLTGLATLPSTVADLYSYYGDELEEMGDYKTLEQLTVQWKSFLDRFFAEQKISDFGRYVLEAYYYVACAQAAIGLKQYDKADQMLAEVHSRVPSEAEYVGQSWLYYKGEVLLRRGLYHQALEYNNRRFALIDNTDMGTAVPVLVQRTRILEGLGRYQEASSVFKSLVELKDSVSGAETRNQLNEMNTLFKVDELEREQEQLKMEKERAQFRNTLIIISLVVVALLVFTIFRIRAARRLKKAHDELLVAYDQLEETTTAKERIESDLRIARNIQMGMVPRDFPERPDVDLYGSMTPAKEVGGDLYGYLLVPARSADEGDKLYFALGDVSGKGVPASLFMAQATRLFRTLAAQEMMPAEIATRINDALSGEDNETCMFVTMFLGLVDLRTGHLDFCNAGHNPPVLLRDGKAEFIEMIPNAPIGLFPGMEYEGEVIDDITNSPLFIYTDGLNEAENRQQEQFTDERLLDILEHTEFVSSRQTVEMLREQVEAHRDGAEPNDDLTMLCIKTIKL